MLWLIVQEMIKGLSQIFNRKTFKFCDRLLLKKKGKKDYLNEKIIITSNQEPPNDDSNIIKANYKKL